MYFNPPGSSARGKQNIKSQVKPDGFTWLFGGSGGIRTHEPVKAT